MGREARGGSTPPPGTLERKQYVILDQQQLLKLAHENGGVLLVSEGENIRAILAVDPQDPHRIFDRLNELEVELVRGSGNSLQKVRRVGEWVDELRARVKVDMTNLGLPVPT